MPKTYIIAEQYNIADFRIKHIVVSDREPLDELRKGIIETIQSYSNHKIPNTTVNIFQVTDNKRAGRIVNAAEQDWLFLFLEAKYTGNTVSLEVVNIQRAAWLHTQQKNVLDYSLRNGGGYCKKRAELIQNEDFQQFITDKCLP